MMPRAGRELQVLVRLRDLFGHLRVMEGSGLCETILRDEDMDWRVVTCAQVPT